MIKKFLWFYNSVLTDRSTEAVAKKLEGWSHLISLTNGSLFLLFIFRYNSVLTDRNTEAVAKKLEGWSHLISLTNGSLFLLFIFR